MFIVDRSVTVKSVTFAALSVLEISKWKNGVWTLSPHRHIKIVQNQQT